jgi:zinc transport system ATP-binding protein
MPMTPPRSATGSPPFRLTGGQVTLSGEPVLTAMDLVITRGSFVVILGQNGTGKSTLLRALLGLVPLDHGDVLIYGDPPTRFRDWARIGYVPQHLLSAGAVPVSVKEVVGAALIGPASRWRRRPRSDAVRSALDAVGLWERRNDSLSTLSGGQQRRVMIAAALAKDSDTLLLDEPTAGVDAENVAHLVGLLSAAKDTGATVIVVTHELGDLASLATRCVVLGHRPGASVLYDGPPPGPRSLADPHGHHDDPPPPSAWELPR